MALPHPPLLLVTDRKQAMRPLVDVVAAALAAGCRWISLREKELDQAEQVALVQTLRALAAQHAARVTVHGDARLAHHAGADGVHLPAGADVEPARRMLGEKALIGMSVHRVHELHRAPVGLDYVIVGPAYATASKPGYGPALGPAGIARFAVAQSEDTAPPSSGRDAVPVIAIGGITPENAAPLIAAGAAGVAVMGGVMRADDPRAEVEALIAALGRR